LPFNAPKKYWDLYEPDDLEMAQNPFRPEGVPDAAMHNFGELRNYTGIPAKGSLSEEMSRTLVHGYYACVSYTDAQIGKLLDVLDELELANNTIVILWGDHGWNLGEHGLWCKHCNFETSLHTALMIKVPGIKGGKKTNALTEFVDIYPSLCELTGLPVPHHLQGMSFVPLLSNPDQPWKQYVFSKWHNGFSIKNEQYRYTEWSRKDSTITQYARMLYDHVNDSLENHNIAEGVQNQELIDQLSHRLRQEWGEDFTIAE
jgi:arylsulfatase A-like enzyme